ncbi:MAG TPA: class I SAM-dependent methyltransferase [Acidimicrobiales bacterium]|nr:class I SAM-dependent methyltransferase [Acidimicrobiales bacterium]
MPLPQPRGDTGNLRPDRFPTVKRKGQRLTDLVETLRHLTLRLEDVATNQAAIAYTIARSPALIDFSVPCADDPLSSRVCRQVDCGAEYRSWQEYFGRTMAVDRKDWEWAAICRAMESAGVLKPGARALGFGVGSEPLVAALAAKGLDIVATDLALGDPRTSQWVEHSLSISTLRRPDICPDDELERRVTMRSVDMNHIPSDLRGFDVVWSCCAFEHLGSIEQGLRFVESSLDCLKPGGIAIHTTEFNLSSGDETEATGGTVAFRTQDFLELERRIARRGHSMSPFTEGERGPGIFDYFVDVPPKHYGTLICRLADYLITPAIIIAHAGPGGE